MAPRSEIAATKLRLALLKSLCNPGAQPSWLWGRRASCPPTKEQSNRQDACLPHRLEAYAPPAPKLFQQGQAASSLFIRDNAAGSRVYLPLSPPESHHFDNCAPGTSGIALPVLA